MPQTCILMANFFAGPISASTLVFSEHPLASTALIMEVESLFRWSLDRHESHRVVHLVNKEDLHNEAWLVHGAYPEGYSAGSPEHLGKIVIQFRRRIDLQYLPNYTPHPKVTHTVYSLEEISPLLIHSAEYYQPLQMALTWGIYLNTLTGNFLTTRRDLKLLGNLELLHLYSIIWPEVNSAGGNIDFSMSSTSQHYASFYSIPFGSGSSRHDLIAWADTRTALFPATRLTSRETVWTWWRSVSFRRNSIIEKDAR